MTQHELVTAGLVVAWCAGTLGLVGFGVWWLGRHFWFDRYDHD